MSFLSPSLFLANYDIFFNYCCFILICSDRPDNMAVFEKIRLEADKESYPMLLSNGNFVESGDLDDKRHFAVWSGKISMN